MKIPPLIDTYTPPEIATDEAFAAALERFTDAVACRGYADDEIEPSVDAEYKLGTAWVALMTTTDTHYGLKATMEKSGRATNPIRTVR